MNDPHVEWLKYRLKTTPYDRFDSPPLLVQEYDAFHIYLEDGVLTIEMKEHHDSVQSAKQAVEIFLKSWKIDAALKYNRSFIDFEFDHPSVIDRNPLPKTPQGLTIDLFARSGNLTIEIEPCQRQHQAYPKPPSNFIASPDVETMWFRYEQHIDGRETLQAMGYFCLSLIQWSTGLGARARQKAGEIYRIDREVLDKLGNLTSERGSMQDIRKLENKANTSPTSSLSKPEPLTDIEKNWIREAIKRLIRRKGEYDNNPSEANTLPIITMADLPNL
jgi:hypothetical protein